jgi:hypothetical protein
MLDRRKPANRVLFDLAAIVTLVFVFGGPELTSHPDASSPPSAADGIAAVELSASPPTRSEAAPSPSAAAATPAATTPAGPTPALSPSAAVAVASPSAAAAQPTAPHAPAPSLAPVTKRNPTPVPPTPPSAPPPGLGACAILPASNVWNRPVDGLPVASNSATMVAAIGLGAGLHPDFSDGGWYGIPFNIVGTATPRSIVSFDYLGESDHVGYPIPANPAIEGGSDRHILMVETNECRLYELFAAQKSGSSWSAGSGATWDLGSNALRPAGWTSADAAGLPIFPGLVRYDELATGAIHHAIRFTAPTTCNGYIYPARHEAGSGSCAVNPPMGLRVRLKASVDTSGFGPQARIVLQALKTYGMLLADNGSPWYITGAPHTGWDDDDLHDLGQIHGDAFEVVDTTGFVNG